MSDTSSALLGRKQLKELIELRIKSQEWHGVLPDVCIGLAHLQSQLIDAIKYGRLERSTGEELTEEVQEMLDFTNGFLEEPAPKQDSGQDDAFRQ